MIQTIDNFYLSDLVYKSKKDEIEKYIIDSKKYYAFFDKNFSSNDKKIIGERIDILLKNYQNKKSPNNTFFSFFKDEEKKAIKNEDDLIISIKKDGENYLAQTGNYVGKFVWQGLEIDIKSRFSNTFLERMLNFANDIFLDDVSITGNKVDKDFDISKYIIYYMFVQNLEKAFLLGLPKAYKSIEHHEMKLKGKIDINKFIKYDIPFQGNISSVSREQKEIQEIIDVLYKAVKIIDKNNKAFLKNISHIKTHLKQYKSNNYVSNETINRALKSKALQNPIFAPYKKVLEYARFIINGNNIEEKKDGAQETFGFIINVAELFEIYITKLLQKEFRDWNIESPKIELYSNQFFARKIIPDIVMKKDNDVIVFDTKYKKMLMRDRYQNGGDVDRNDFFQINTYMSYYQNQNQNYNVKIGGLLYPIEKSFIENKYICHSETWFGNLNTKFIVDGIDLSNLEESKDNENKFSQIVIREKEFINRIKKLLD
ncbi:McrC family protein [Aliarcobacter cryaerophilus]|uniref:McrC family protein n=1 Tax=Aliarcobacter cryaerophilus TaxID=28198 RepID=UPI0021B65198|nr:McrC family protein [Aliarcobacter cryaerophilus]MCT7492597.1 McrC family protein [Aliarcobacter cryaerophilus]